MTERSWTMSSAFLEALADAGISYIFANLGSDHPGIIEASPRPRPTAVRTSCPHEKVTLSAAHAYAMVTGEPQAVVIHVDSAPRTSAAW